MFNKNFMAKKKITCLNLSTFPNFLFKRFGSSHDNLMTIDPKDVVCGIASVVHTVGPVFSATQKRMKMCPVTKGENKKKWILFDGNILFPYHIYR